MNLFYAGFKVFMRLSLRVYFKRIRLEGIENIPTNLPLIVAPNHQNAFLDALLVGAFFPIPLYYLTRSDIFTWWSKPLLRLLNMMPIYRIRDGYAKLSQNEAVFESCKNLFAEKKSLLIFPEGNHGEHHYLRPISKGTARIALQSQQAIETDIMIQPVGINYFSHQEVNSTVLIAFGNPIAVSRYLDHYTSDPSKTLLELKEKMSEGMKATLAIPEQTDDYVERAQTVFAERNSTLSLSQLREIQSPKAPQKTSSRKRIVSRLLNPLPFLVSWKIVRGVNDPVFHSSLKFAVAAIVFPVWWLLAALAISHFFGIFVGLICVLVMIFSLIIDYKW